MKVPLLPSLKVLIQGVQHLFSAFQWPICIHCELSLFYVLSKILQSLPSLVLNYESLFATLALILRHMLLVLLSGGGVGQNLCLNIFNTE